MHKTVTYPMADVSGSSPLTSSRILWMLTSPFIRGPFFGANSRIEVQMTKGLWWIPRHPETKKGVESDDMLRGAENKH